MSRFSEQELDQIEQGLRAELRQIVEDRARQGVSTHPQLIIQEVISRHSSFSCNPEYKELYTFCAWKGVAQLLKSEFPHMSVDIAQLLKKRFPDWSAEDMCLDDDEAQEDSSLLTADDYRKQADALLKHAQELEEYEPGD
jgi:hypothetical protein